MNNSERRGQSNYISRSHCPSRNNEGASLSGRRCRPVGSWAPGRDGQPGAVTLGGCGIRRRQEHPSQGAAAQDPGVSPTHSAYRGFTRNSGGVLRNPFKRGQTPVFPAFVDLPTRDFGVTESPDVTEKGPSESGGQLSGRFQRDSLRALQQIKNKQTNMTFNKFNLTFPGTIQTDVW